MVSASAASITGPLELVAASSAVSDIRCTADVGAALMLDGAMASYMPVQQIKTKTRTK